jgi:alpha-L-fucosidase
VKRVRIPGSILLALAGAPVAGTAAQAPVPVERVAAREWFRDAGFGMFIHWGVYSQHGQGEWVMQNRSKSIPTYDLISSAFIALYLAVKEWVSLA